MISIINRAEKIFRNFVPKRMSGHNLYREKLKNKNGLEIGGPSPAFDSKGFLPLYDIVQSLDGVNFSSETVWEGKLSEGNTYEFGGKLGHQYISDAVSLDVVDAAKYDFILSCHSVEHLANPLKAIKNWIEKLTSSGYLLLVVPHKDQTFDHKRPLTTLSHLVNDFKNQQDEKDETHFEEVLNLHDLDKDAGVPNMNSLRERTLQNIENRCVHHHVFNTPLIAQIADYLELQILDLQTFSPFHIVCLLQKSEAIKVNNSKFLDKNAAIYQKEKFPSDKIWL